MQLNNHQVRHLRGLAHALRPVVRVGGKGLTETVLAELELALEHHELVKVQVAIDDREARSGIVEALVTRSRAQTVQKIGKVVCLYRRHPETPRIELPR